ncbi:response regulator [Rhodococcus sp. RS1C4]|nr:response regulator [Rhodococcus sp. RS1C4]OZD59279.1 response regulator [Rhodococcus sp. 06-1059B-a]OZE84698.1 response regulator [Rhodococcus sp. 15-649-1-2]
MSAEAASDTLGEVKSFARSCLIVDDSDAFCLSARRMLEATDVTVVGTASTLAQAVEIVLGARPDLVLVDIDLGDESGFDVVEAIAEAGAESRPSIILVSTHDEDDFADLVESSSAVGFLPKFDLSAESIRTLLTTVCRDT